jgi:hypothetical protein
MKRIVLPALLLLFAATAHAQTISLDPGTDHFFAQLPDGTNAAGLTWKSAIFVQGVTTTGKCGLSGPMASRFANQFFDMEFLGLEQTFTSTGGPLAYGYLRIGCDTSMYISVILSLYDKDGTLLGVSSVPQSLATPLARIPIIQALGQYALAIVPAYSGTVHLRYGGEGTNGTPAQNASVDIDVTQGTPIVSFLRELIDLSKVDPEGVLLVSMDNQKTFYVEELLFQANNKFTIMYNGY